MKQKVFRYKFIEIINKSRMRFKPSNERII